ncbi:hypothetical protein [Psychrobacter sp. I-STPA10]|uniref:hypothetical protein n=1 Tax=Psychrobacter sp. I-STPA10 TaxID=2585769 RepID=UPI001E59E1FE|nr:hypothetical protein [Psychrobacter sp. I-STPA10]
MSEAKKVVFIGWHPDAIDFSKIPNLTAEKLIAQLEKDRQQLNELGYDAEILFIDSPQTAYDTVADAMKQTPYDCVLIGAGVRLPEPHFLVFEKVVNAVHEYAPQAKICFNTSPMDTAESVQRWV